MDFNCDGETYNVNLIDDGTLDTVVSVDGVIYRISQETAVDYRLPDGSLNDENLWNLVNDNVIDDHIESLA